MILLSRPLRPGRAHEWSRGKAVTFIVTLAATRSVTLAARAAGMSRKAAYALKSRDPAFADAWKIATAARRSGDTVKDMAAPAKPPGQGNSVARSASSNSSSGGRYPRERRVEEALRDRFLARLVALRADSPPVARRTRLP